MWIRNIIYYAIVLRIYIPILPILPQVELTFEHKCTHTYNQ